jgi:hypothetical protein
VVDILQEVDKYCAECLYEEYSQLTLEDLDYLANELDSDFDELVAILRENI